MAEVVQKQHIEEHAEKSHPNYGVIMVALAVITAIEIVLAEFVRPNLGGGGAGIVLAALVVLSFAKIVLVAQYYMHLQSDSKWFTYIFLVPIPFMALISIILIVGGILATAGV